MTIFKLFFTTLLLTLFATNPVTAHDDNPLHETMESIKSAYKQARRSETMNDLSLAVTELQAAMIDAQGMKPTPPKGIDPDKANDVFSKGMQQLQNQLDKVHAAVTDADEDEARKQLKAMAKTRKEYHLKLDVD